MAYTTDSTLTFLSNKLNALAAKKLVLASARNLQAACLENLGQTNFGRTYRKTPGCSRNKGFA